MQLSPYLCFDGQCEAAFKFYEQCLGGKLEAVMTYSGSPLAENGTVTTPMEKTFWAEKFGMVVDQFGSPWGINCELVAE